MPIDPFKYKDDMYLKTGNTNYDSFGPLSQPSFDVNQIILPSINLSDTTPTPTPTPSASITPTPTPTITPTPTPTPTIVKEEEFLPDREDLETTVIFDDGPRHVEGNNLKWIESIGSVTTTFSDVNLSEISIPLIMYLGHQQGPAGIKAILYYGIKEPKDKVPKPNKFTSADINYNMYGKTLYPGRSSVGNVYAPEFNKVYGSSYTPGNFIKYWINKFKSIYNSAQKVTKYDSLFSTLSTKYGVSIDLIKTVCKIESGFNPDVSTGSYKGLFQLSDKEFKQYYPTGNIFDPTQNATVGVQLLKQRYTEAQKTIQIIK